MENILVIFEANRSQQSTDSLAYQEDVTLDMLINGIMNPESTFGNKNFFGIFTIVGEDVLKIFLLTYGRYLEPQNLMERLFNAYFGTPSISIERKHRFAYCQIDLTMTESYLSLQFGLDSLLMSSLISE